MGQVLIVGGGVAGLTAALRLSLEHEHEVLVLEAGERLGGQLLTELDQGFVVERGGEGFVARSEAVPALARDLGLPETELIGQSELRSYGYDGSELRELRAGEAATLLGFQVPQEELGRGIRSLRRGMGSLIWALAGNLSGRARIALGTRVLSVGARGASLEVRCADGRALQADAVVVATSAAAASALLAEHAGEPARALAAARVLSSVTVELAYPRDAVAHALDGSGFVVALDAQQQGLRACTFTSSKFADRAPPGSVSLRAFFRPSDDELAALDDAAWIARARGGIARVIPVHGEPVRAWVSRWPAALPVFDDAHRAAVEALERALAPLPIALAGSAFHGSGIDAAVRSGERAAAAVGERLAAR